MPNRKTHKSNFARMLIALHIISFIAFVGWQLFISFATPYLVFNLVSFGATVLFVAAAAGSYMPLLRGEKLPLLTQTIQWAVTGLFLIVVAGLGIGLVQDIIGMSCRGFMGASESCVTSTGLLLLFTVLSPMMLTPALFIASVALVIVRTISDIKQNNPR